MEKQEKSHDNRESIEITSLAQLLAYTSLKWWHVLAVIVGITFTPLYAYLTLGWSPSQIGLSKEHWHSSGSSLVIVVASLTKSLLFFNYVIIILREDKDDLWKYYKFIGQVLPVMLLITISFAIDYYFCYWFDSNYFTGISENNERMYFDFFYYSFMTLTTVGYGEIVAVGKSPMCVAMIEVALSIALFIGIIGGFDNILSGFRGAGKKNEKPNMENLRNFTHPLPFAKKNNKRRSR
ncbi:potassium channel family protein [Persicitalea jodogahamensis]|uniref:Potassium channel domain-containing protein n=1 Tax=Persicitalea jodogahamensis TaxID=402147 RepID=A0A8J3D2W1_9BACT|nr:potassium channel family protein [Persicitalea jodogahamensis]GHB64236.1 hypothetical protein GCM10007390_17650 [Persicitalea jodogahamensis]